MVNVYPIPAGGPSLRDQTTRGSNELPKQSGIKWLTWAWTRPLDNAPERLVLVALANHANSGGTCWPSVGRLVAMTCLGERTVRAKLQSLRARGEISITQRDGTSSLYTLTPAGDAPLQEMHPAGDADPSGSTCTLPLQEVHPTPAGGAPKLPITPIEHPTEPGVSHKAPHTQDFRDIIREFEEVYPRLGSSNATEAALKSAIAEGADPAQILAGARVYAAEQASTRKQYIALSENWLRNKRWAQHARTREPSVSQVKVLQLRANTILEGKDYLCRSITAVAARECIEAGLVTIEQCRAAGVQV